MQKIREYKLNKIEKKFLRDQNINEIIVPPRHDILFYFHLIANKNEVMNEHHIMVKWSDYIFNKYKGSNCPIKPCQGCPTRFTHLNVAAKKYNFELKSEEMFLPKTLSEQFNTKMSILLQLSKEEIRAAFENFIHKLINEPKSNGKKRASSSIETYINQLKKWEEYRNNSHNLGLNITKNIKSILTKDFDEIKIIESEDLNKISDFILNENIWRNSLIHMRIKAIYFIMIHTGIRQNELIQLNKMDYQDDLIKINGKYGDRRVALNKSTQLQLNTYLKSRIDQEAPLFVNQDYKKLTKSSIENSWKRISSKLNIHFSSMDLRKTSAVLFAMSGASNEELKNIYGFKTNAISNKYFYEGKNRLALEKQRKFSPVK